MKRKIVPDLSASLLTEEEHTRLLGMAGQGASPNPMVRRHGFCVLPKTCKTCRFHITNQFTKSYHKCALNAPERYESTDIRVSWDACAKYEETNK